MDKTLKHDNPDSQRKFNKSEQDAKVLSKLITQAMNGTSVANQCSHQMLLIE